MQNPFRTICDGETTAQRFSDLCDAIRNHPDCADAIVFIGDILDFFTESAFDFMCENLRKLLIPYIFTLGNEGICIGDSWKKVLGLIEAEDTKIRALVCGDGHIEHESSIGGSTQFVSPLGAKYPPVRFTVHA